MKFIPLPSGYVSNMEAVAFIAPGKYKNRINITFLATYSSDRGGHPMRLPLLPEDSFDLLKQLSIGRAFDPTQLKAVIARLPEPPQK